MNGWRKLSNGIMNCAIAFMAIAGYGAARNGDTVGALFVICCLSFILIGISDERKIEKLENTIFEQESVILRTQYIRNKMLEEKNG